MAFAGFDTIEYPGDDVMAWLKANTNLSIAGFNLAPSPSLGTSKWMTRRATLLAQGWGLAPLFGAAQPFNISNDLNEAAQQGGLAGSSAVDLMQQAEFPAHSVVYLGLETSDPLSPVMINYVGAWFNAVGFGNFYTPALQCSHLTAASMLAFRPDTRLWCWNVQGVPPGPDFPPDFPANDPSGCGAQATMWQWAQNVGLPLTGAPVDGLLLNLNSASVADPSKPQASRRRQFHRRGEALARFARNAQ